MPTGNFGVLDQSTNGLSSGLAVKIIDTNEIILASTTSVAAITTEGINIVTPVSMVSITVGIPLLVDSILSGVQETVIVTATTGTTFTADFSNLHSAGFSIGLKVERQNFSIADPTNFANVATVSGSALWVNDISSNVLAAGTNTIGNVKLVDAAGVNQANVSAGGAVLIYGGVTATPSDAKSITNTIQGNVLNSNILITLGNGQSTIGINWFNNTGNAPNATISFQVSNDNNLWYSVNAVQTQTNTVVTSSVNPTFIGRCNVAGYLYFRIIVTSVASGAANIPVYLDMSTGVGVTSLDSLQLKGVQATSFLPIQKAADTGRQPFNMNYNSGTATAVVGVTTEALLTMAVNVNGATSSSTSYTVPAGKTLRIQSLDAHSVTTTGTNYVNFFSLRALVGGGTLLATSPPFYEGFVGANGTGADSTIISIADGLEFATGAVLGISQVSNNASTTRYFAVNLIGFLY